MGTLGKILLLGKNGQVGSELWRTLSPLGDVIAMGRPEIDYAKVVGLRKIIKEIGPKIIVNAVAYTAVDYAESNYKAAHQVNAVAPRVLAREAKAVGAMLVHFSTDYVYDGEKPEDYLEVDAMNPVNAYGLTKSLGDEAVQASGCNYLIFRLSWVYGGPWGKNFMMAIMDKARNHELLQVVSNHYGAPTWSAMVAEATTLAIARTGASEMNQVYHMSAAGRTSWHGFAEAIVAGMPQTGVVCKKVVAVLDYDLPNKVKRPVNCVLSNQKLLDAYGIALPSWTNQLHLAMRR